MAYKRISPEPVIEGGTGAQTLTGVLTGNGTSAITANVVTQYGTIIAGASNAVSSIAPSATTGIPYISQGSAANPAFGTAVVAGGGTGETTFTAYSIIAAGTTATGPFQNVVGLGSLGQVLTSAGAASLPAWMTPAANSITITGDTGGGLTGNSFTFAGGSTGLSFGGAGSTETLTFAGITANGGTVSLATDATTSIINIGTGAGAKTVTLGSTNTTSTTNLQSGSGGIKIPAFTQGALVTSTTGVISTVTGTAGFILTANAGAAPSFQPGTAATISITGDTGGALTAGSFTFTGGTTGLSFGGAGTTETLTFAGITANNGVVNLGTDSTANAINIGTASNTGRVITIGNTTGTTGISEFVGTGNYSLDGVAGSTYAIGASTTTGTITIGGSSQSGSITLGQSANTIFLNSSSNAASIRIAYNQTAGSVFIGHNMTTGTIELGSTAAQTGTISIAPGTGAQTINIATAGTGVKTVNIANGAVSNVVAIGSTTGAASLTLNSGSAGIVAKGVASVAVSNKNYVTINTSTGALGSDSGATSNITITGDTGGGLTGSSFTFAGGTTGITFSGSGSTETLVMPTLNFPNSTSSSTGIIEWGGTPYIHNYNQVGGNNFFAGGNAGNFTLGIASSNTGIGDSSLAALTNGSNNAALGRISGNSITTGSSNTCIGHQALDSLTTGSNNVAIGEMAGSSYNGAESSNISIGVDATGTGGESNTLRIGSGTGTATGNLNTSFISGIYGITTVSATTSPVLVSNGDQLGTIISSRRFKNTIQDMGDVSSAVLKMRPVTFYYNAHTDNVMQYGLIAEEVEQIMPQIINYDNEGLAASVRYHDMPMMILNELQKALMRIESLEKALDDLSQKNK